MKKTVFIILLLLILLFAVSLGCCASDGKEVSFSELVRLESALGCPASESGGNQMSIVRTDSASYAVIVSDYGVPDGEYNYTHMTADVVKISEEGDRKLFSFDIPDSDVMFASEYTCKPNILFCGGYVYVVSLANDRETFLKTGTESALMSVYKIDINDGDKTVLSCVSLPFKYQGIGGYAYSMPCLDSENGRIYCIYIGGEAPSYVSWFVYDLKTDMWRNQNFSFKTDFRECYIHAYPDGKNGFFFVGQRIVTGNLLSEALGIPLKTKDAFCFDAGHITSVPDPFREEYTLVSYFEPDYSNDEPNRSPAIMHYSRGDTMVDSRGNIHIVHMVSDESGNYVKNVVFDRNFVKLKDEIMTFSLPTYKSVYYPKFYESSSGRIYLLLFKNSSKKALAEIRESSDGGMTYGFISEIPLIFENTSDLGTVSCFASTSRNGSVCDDTMDLFFHLGTGNETTVYFTVSFPEYDTPPSVKKFNDVKDGTWYKTYVDYVVYKGLMTGVSDTSFAPGTVTSRAMLVTILYRLEGEPSFKTSVPFTDLKQSWYKNAVAWAYENNIVNGTDKNSFSPDGPITREQLAAILFRFSSFRGYDVSGRKDLSSFPDSKRVSSYASDALSYAYAESLITGTASSSEQTVLDPKGSATRAQIAAILMRYCTRHS